MDAQRSIELFQSDVTGKALSRVRRAVHAVKRSFRNERRLRASEEARAMTEDKYELGMKIRRQVLGDEYVDRAMASADEFSADFQRIVTEYCWGGTWGRPGLSLKQRSLNNLCMLAALNRGQEFETHFRGAMRNGCTTDELRETLIQIATYCGIPAGVEAFRIARKVLAEEKAKESATQGETR
jgi:4-carboxymuconolactone decarboxylase